MVQEIFNANCNKLKLNNLYFNQLRILVAALSKTLKASVLMINKN